MKFKEVKRNVGGKRLVAWCDLIARGPSETILLYHTDRDYVFQGIHIPKGSTTKAHYWPDRNYTAWKMSSPVGNLIGYLFHICEGMIIDDDNIVWNDLVVDLWVDPDSRHRVLDEDELADFLEQGLVNEDQSVTIDQTKVYLEKNYQRIIEDTFWENRVQGIMFDMDGTITQNYIDWSKLRAEIGVREGETILEHIEALEEENQPRATGILESHEDEAARNSSLNDGVREVLDEISRIELNTCLVTNNSRRSVDTVLGKHKLEFDCILTREDGEPKPSEHLLLKAQEILGLGSDEVVFVGDGRYDLIAGKRAGIKTIMLLNENENSKYQIQNPDDYECELFIRNLKDLLGFWGLSFAG